MYKFAQLIVCFVQVMIYTVNLGQPSGMMGHDDLHKTTGQNSELQQEPQEESSFNEGTIILLIRGNLNPEKNVNSCH